MRVYYETIKVFRDYVDAYATSRKITVEEALTHKLVRNVLKYYKETYKTVTPDFVLDSDKYNKFKEYSKKYTADKAIARVKRFREEA